MKSNYYCTVAGLPDITLDDTKLSFTVGDFKEELYPELTLKDRKLLDIFYLQFDNRNLLALIKSENTEPVFDSSGNFSSDELEELVELVQNGEESVKGFPAYMVDFLVAFYAKKEEEVANWEDRLSVGYYNYAMKSNNQFISSWYTFCLHLNNIQLALASRRHGISYAETIVGNTEVCEAIRKSNARDFGLSAELPYMSDLLKLDEMVDLVERERKTDLLKWEWMEEASFYDYFSLERLFVFLLKLEMIERWISLDKIKGNQKFRAIIDSLKNDVQIPEEFKK